MDPANARIVRALESDGMDPSRHIVLIYEDRFCTHPRRANGSAKASRSASDDDDVGLR